MSKDLTTKYLGLELKNPLVIGSSGLSDSIDKIKELEANGAAAIVLKSIFEEEILLEMKKSQQEMSRPGTLYPEIFDYFDLESMQDSATKYINYVEEAKKNSTIPIIASVNCVSKDDWFYFAKRLQDAGADALELNLFVMPSNFGATGTENEKVYFDIVKEILNISNLPISLKISYYFSNLAQVIKELSETGVKGLTLFNRFFSPDFDIDNFSVIPANITSTESELPTSLRWVAIMADRISCDLAASTGAHSGEAVIKQLLAGANAVHVVSALYKNKPSYLKTMLEDIESWMDKKGFDSVNDFRGKMSQSMSDNPAAYERAQFMKHFSLKLT